MTSNRARRILKEIADIKQDTLSQIIVDFAGSDLAGSDNAGSGIASNDISSNADDISHLRGQFKGPPDTPYEGGIFYVDIRMPPEYPFRPPLMKFDTKIWHPNVSSQTVRIPCCGSLRQKLNGYRRELSALTRYRPNGRPSSPSSPPSYPYNRS